MTQDTNNSKHYTADEGKVFQRIHNGFTAIEQPYIVGTSLILGEILIDSYGNKLDEPIPDKIEYYEEIDAPVQEEPQAEESTEQTEEPTQEVENDTEE